MIFSSTLSKCEAWVAQRPDAEEFVLIQPPFCSCCGVINHYGRHEDVAPVAKRGGVVLYRCDRHRESNPCAVDGCTRTRGARRYFDDRDFLCADHWKIACPPRTPERAVYNRLFKLKRQHSGKDGPWPRDLITRYERVWGAIVRRARNETAGDIDMQEINAMFGWDQ